MGIPIPHVTRCSTLLETARRNQEGSREITVRHGPDSMKEPLSPTLVTAQFCWDGDFQRFCFEISSALRIPLGRLRLGLSSLLFTDAEVAKGKQISATTAAVLHTCPVVMAMGTKSEDSSGCQECDIELLQSPFIDSPTHTSRTARSWSRRSDPTVADEQLRRHRRHPQQLSPPRS